MTITETRHHDLDHHLPADVADITATHDHITDIAHTLIDVANITATVCTNPTRYETLTGATLDRLTLGNATKENTTIYIAVHGTIADITRVAAHEITHLTHWSYGHRIVFFTRAQQLLNRFAHHPHHQTLINQWRSSATPAAQSTTPAIATPTSTAL